MSVHDFGANRSGHRWVSGGTDQHVHDSRVHSVGGHIGVLRLVFLRYCGSWSVVVEDIRFCSSAFLVAHVVVGLGGREDLGYREVVPESGA